MKSKTTLISIIFALMIIPLSGCGLLEGETTETQITASGTISADKFTISPQVGGMIKEIFVQEGENVQLDQQLFHLDDEIMKAQYNQAMAAVDQADAGIQAAQSQLNSASVQYDRARQG
ncbi:MAG: biotin/lipoyl-binding protein, partial [Anaerolineaceae bacterium]|nr:biotin/lipoyl-binding protein [Anaerolineaceae bacterium]